MTTNDLEQFQQAIALAQSGNALQKQQAYTILLRLVRAYPDESKVWLWMAFTAPSLSEAEITLSKVQMLDPLDPALPSAWVWLNNQKANQKVDEADDAFSNYNDEQFSYSNQPSPNPTYPNANSYLFPDTFSQKHDSAWEFELEDGIHTVEFSNSESWKTATLLVDNIFSKFIERRWWDGTQIFFLFIGIWWRLIVSTALKVYEFKLGQHICHIRKVAGFYTSYDLLIDGRSIKTKEFLSPITFLPLWSGLFALGCLLILFFTKFQFSTLALAFLGIGSCLMIARETAQPTSLRLALCSGVVVLCWILTFALLGVKLR